MPRQHERFPHYVEVLLDSASGRHIARISDIGIDGCFVDTIADTEAGEPVSFEITESGRPLRFTGEVRYRFTGVGFGMRFNELSDESCDYIRRIIDGSQASDASRDHEFTTVAAAREK